MRTKSLLFAAALSLAGVASAVAQNNVYSVNAVGYVNLTMPKGFFSIANPLNSTNNTVKSLISGVPDFSAVYKWNGNGFDVSTYAFGNWSAPNMTLNPGEGAFFSNAGSGPVTLTFVGEVLQGNLVNNIATGFSMKGSQVPQTATVTAMGLNAAAGLTDFDAVYKWNGTSYDTYTYAFGNWAPASPTINVGEAFFISAQKPIAWARTFSVNQ